LRTSDQAKVKALIRELHLTGVRFKGELEPYSPERIISFGGNLVEDMLSKNGDADFWRLNLIMLGHGQDRAKNLYLKNGLKYDGQNVELGHCKLVILRGSSGLPQRLRKPRFNRTNQLAQLIAAGDVSLERLFYCAMEVEAKLSKNGISQYSMNMLCAIDRICTAPSLRGGGLGWYFIDNLPDLIHLYMGVRPGLFVLQCGDYNHESDKMGISKEEYIDKLVMFYEKCGFSLAESFLGECSVRNTMLKPLFTDVNK